MENLRRVSLLPIGLLLLSVGCSGTNSGSSKTDIPGRGPPLGVEGPTEGVPTSGSAGTGSGSTGTGTTSGDLGGTGSGTTGAGIGTTAPETSPTGTSGAVDTVLTSGSGGTTGTAGTADTAGTTGAAGSTVVVTTPPTQVVDPAGKLTAGTWDDNLNFDFYSTYLATMNSAQVPGLPLIDRTGRLEITAVDGAGAAVAGAQVTVSDAAGKLFESTTRGDGRLFFFPAGLPASVGGGAAPRTGAPLTISATLGQTSASVAAHVGDAQASVVLPTTAAPIAALDLAIVVDTTGSMGDELSYLQVELDDIITRVAHDFPNVSQRWSAIFYRDTVDEYVVRAFDFTTSLATLENNIAAQSAAGGGDIPESPDQALAKLPTLSWRPGAVARMAFWVADAPHHAAQAQTMAQDFIAAQGGGIRLYPIAASGTDDLLEYTMRTAAEVTGGRYLFLTNDSGIGNSHKEPTIPCYVVTTLDKAMLRMIVMELTGTDSQPTAADIIRTSGNPKDGTCVLDGGQIVTVL